MFRLIASVLCLVAVSHELSITKFEVPELVEVGGSAELICEHDAAIPAGVAKWWWVPVGGTKQQIYQHVGLQQTIMKPHVGPPFNATVKSKHLDNLVIWDMKAEHTGSFKCEIQNAAYKEIINENAMVVYSMGSGVLLNMTKFEDDDNVQLTCEAVGVAPKPNIAISVLSYTFNTSTLHGPESGLYSVFTNATFTEEELEGQEVTCMISFDELDVEIPSGLLAISDTYHSDAWLASTAAPSEETSTPLEASNITTAAPGSSGRFSSSWLLFAALAIPATLIALL